MIVIYYYGYGTKWLESKKPIKVYELKVFYLVDDIPFFPTKETGIWFSSDAFEYSVRPNDVLWNQKEKYVEVSFEADHIEDLSFEKQNEIFSDMIDGGWKECSDEDKYDIDVISEYNKQRG